LPAFLILIGAYKKRPTNRWPMTITMAEMEVDGCRPMVLHLRRHEIRFIKEVYTYE